MARIQGAATEKVESFDVNQRLEISLQLGLLSNKVRLMVVDKKAADELAMLIIEMGFSNELASARSYRRRFSTCRVRSLVSARQR